jgi:hypothetical protein
MCIMLEAIDPHFRLLSQGSPAGAEDQYDSE